MSTLDRFYLTGKTAVVAGGEGLIGKMVCEVIRKLGGYVVSLDVQIGANYMVDCTQLSRLEAIADKHLPKVDILVHCIVWNQKPVTFPESGWVKDLSVGLDSAVNLMTVFRHKIKESAGVVLFFGSDLSLIAPDPERYGAQYKPLSYSVIKHGIVGMTRYWAAHMPPARVNCLCPGGVDVGQDPVHCPLGRLATLDDLRGPVAFLLSDASSYMTGASLVVDGGRTIW